ncbi:hypothetical protein [Microbacterium sp. nov. GSS16]|uniref:hypothetical protein n=1 Tax=Microbacterium sp. nov. GSS16 TaxID=3019890 RepID=UPI002305D87A|nr:hypothetical protein [Microbacterium sp. nov. GSS16]WCD93083.1 hypothetical protein PGB26_02045 [Microbacterium sp. nov. GSS16]
MAAVAGIAAFIIALFLSYQIFPDPGTGGLGYAGGRFIFTIVVTIVVSVIASKISSNRRAEMERHEAELARQQERDEREAKQRRTEESRKLEDARRLGALQDARERVNHLRSLLLRREQQRRDSAHRLGRFAFGVVDDELLANIVWDKLETRVSERSTISAEQMESLTGDLHISTYRNPRRVLDLEGMQYATRLEGLSIHPIDDEVDLDPIAGLVNLRRLEIRGGRGIANIDAIATLDGLQRLALAHLANVGDFRPLAGLERLSQLELTALPDSLEFDSISGLPSLTKLVLGGMSHFGELSGVSHLRHVTELVLYSTGDLNHVSSLAKLDRLERLTLDDIHLSGAKQVARLTTLTSLSLRNVSGVGNLDGLSALGKLEELELVQVRLDEYRYEGGSLDLGPLSRLANLRKLRLIQGDGYTTFTNWEAVSSLRSLKSLAIEGDLDRTAPMEAISHLGRLEELSIAAAILPGLDALSALTQLQRLEIEGEWIEFGPSSLRDLRSLASLPMLRTLILDTCGGWGLLEDVGQLKSLRHLELKNLHLEADYEDLSPLAGLSGLQTLVLRENSNLVRDLSPLERLPRLTSLTVVSKSYEAPWDTSRLADKPGLTISTR